MTAKPDSRQPNPQAPSILVLRCDECEKRVKRDGYIKIDREAIARNYVMVGEWEVIDPDSPRVYWKILHPDCDPDPKPTDFRLAARKLTTENDLLQCTSWLLRNHPELTAASKWHGLIGRILADTQEHAEWLASPERAEENEARRRRLARRRQQLLADPDDPQHGTENGYTNYGCRCDRCKAANAEQSRRDRENHNGHNQRELIRT